MEDGPPTYETIHEPLFPVPTYREDGFENRPVPDFVPPRKRGQNLRRPTSDWQPPPPTSLPSFPISLTWPWMYDQPNSSHPGRPGRTFHIHCNGHPKCRGGCALHTR